MGASLQTLKKILLYVFLVISFVCFHSCNKQQFHLRENDKKILTPLFNYILFEHFGAFVLFGSKPMCCAQIPIPSTLEEFNRLPERVKENVQIIDFTTDYQQAWDLWERIQKRFSIKKYLFAKREDHIFFINLDTTMKVLEENYDFFQNMSGIHFSPRKILYEIDKVDSVFWEKVFQNHIAMGLLFGFGKDNAEFFDQNPYSENRTISTNEVIDFFQANASHFSIPTFVSSQNHPRVLLYEQQKKRIAEIYKGQDLFQITLKQLTR